MNTHRPGEVGGACNLVICSVASTQERRKRPDGTRGMGDSMGQLDRTTGHLGSWSDTILSASGGVFGDEMSIGTGRADWAGRLRWLKP